MAHRSRIPKAKKSDSQLPIPKQEKFSSRDEGLKFSFEALDKTEYFLLYGTCPNWAAELFDMLKDISGPSVADMVGGNYRTKYRVHNHEKANPPSKLPDGVALKDCYQIRIQSSKGGIHGIFIDNIFYIIWLDPFHNMYPNEHFGGLRKVKPTSTCCMDRDAEIAELHKKIEELEELNRTYEDIFNDR